MRNIMLLAAVIAAIPTPAMATSQTALLSIEHIALGKGQYVSGFDIETLGVVPLRVCRLVRGWDITAGTGIDIFGRLAGSSNGGVANLDRARIGDLRMVYLLQVDDFQPRSAKGRGWARPATFTGTISIGTYGSDKEDRKVKLKAANYILVPSTHCPPVQSF